MDFPAHIADIEQHVRTLAREPGWREYVEKKVAQMAKEQPSMYGHLPKVVSDKIKQERPK